VFTDPTLTIGSTTVKALHLTELRTNLIEAYEACGRTAPTFVTAIGVGVVITAAQIAELRTFVKALEG
jgi:hypothetical protein